MTTPETTTSPPVPVGDPPRRDQALDVARGIAIMMIVLGHVLRGLAASGDLDARSAWYSELDTALYLVHLPVFFLVSALFLGRGVRRHGAAPFLARRLLLLGWVFVLWTAVQGAVMVLAGGAVNERTTPTDVVVGLWHPLGQFWFLPTLAVLTVATVLVAPWSGRARSLGLLGAGTVLSLLGWGHFGTWSGVQGMGIALFFAVGAVLGDERGRALLRSRSAIAAGLVGAAAYAGLLVVADPTAPTDPSVPPTPASVAAGVVASVGGVLALFVLARALTGLRGAGAVAYLGQHSLEIFVVHITAASGSRIVLTRLGLDQPALLAVLGVAAGLIGPILLLLVADRLRLRWLFGPPRRLVDRVLPAD